MITRRGSGGRDGAVGQSTGYGLDVPSFEPQSGARFSLPVYTDPEDQPHVKLFIFKMFA